MADVIYNSYKTDILAGNIDHDADTIKVALVTSSYTPDQDAHDFFNDVTNEVTGTGYTAGGATLASKTVTQDNTDNEGVFDAADVTWSTSTITARAAVLYKSTGTDSTSNLMVYFDFGSDQSSSAGDFTLQWGSEGIVNLT
jgi:hypothetical protein